MSEDTQVEVILKRIKNHHILSYVIVGAIIFLGLITLAEGVKKSGALFGASFANKKSIVEYNADTLDRFLIIAKKIDIFLLEMEHSEDLEFGFQDKAEEFVKIQAELNNFFIRNSIYELNPIAVEQSLLMSEQWELIGNLLKTKPSREVLSVATDTLEASIRAILKHQYEESKNTN